MNPDEMNEMRAEVWASELRTKSAKVMHDWDSHVNRKRLQFGILHFDPTTITLTVSRDATSQKVTIQVPRLLKVCKLIALCARFISDHLELRLNKRVLDYFDSISESGIKDGDIVEFGFPDGALSIIIEVTGRDGMLESYKVGTETTFRGIFDRFCAQCRVHPWVEQRSFLYLFDENVQIDLDRSIQSYGFGEYASLYFAYPPHLNRGVMLQIVQVPASLGLTILFVRKRRPLREVFDKYCEDKNMSPEEKSTTYFFSNDDPEGGCLNLSATVQSYDLLDGACVRVCQSKDLSIDFDADYDIETEM